MQCRTNDAYKLYDAVVTMCCKADMLQHLHCYKYEGERSPGGRKFNTFRCYEFSANFRMVCSA